MTYIHEMDPETIGRLEEAYWRTVGDAPEPDCPPDPTATCVHCGDELQDHVNATDPDGPITLDVAVCLDQDALRVRVVRYLKFQVASADELHCPERTTCEVCGNWVCSEHSTEFASCGGSAVSVHHINCAYVCDGCQVAACEDAAIERADAIRKGEW